MKAKINFDTILKKIKSARKALATKMANKAVNHFKENFREGGFVDATLQPWKPRQKEDKGRAILVKSGLLKRSIKKLKVTPNSIIVGTNSTNYASYHNKGIGNMPQRKFIGRSQALNKALRGLIITEVKKAFK